MLKNCHAWNVVAICKQIWHIIEKKDSLWVRRINAIYLIEEEIGVHLEKTDGSWYWRKMKSVKLKILHLIDNEGRWKPAKHGIFTITSCYKVLNRGGHTWKEAKWIWGDIHPLKYSIISWLAIKTDCLQSKE